MFKVNNLQCKVASSLEGSIGLDLQPADFITLVSCLTTGSLAHDDDRDDDNGGKSNDNSYGSYDNDHENDDSMEYNG